MLNRTFIAFALVVSFAGYTAHAAPATLKEAMGSMGSTLKEINKTAKDPSKDNDNVTRSQTYYDLALSMNSFVPKKVESLSGAEKQAQLLAYLRITHQLQITAIDLQLAFMAHKPDEVQKVFQQISALQKAGHDLFKSE